MSKHDRINRIREAWREGREATGIYVQTSCCDVVEMAGVAGFDYVILDAQHGSIGMESIVGLLRAADSVGITPLVRVPSHEPTFIMRVLDAGAQGVVIPDVESAAQAQAVVSAARYRQGGHAWSRGACPSTRAAWHQSRDWPAFVDDANRTILVWAIIESLAGLEQFAQIARVAGLDAVIPGTFDLSHEMGLPGERTHPAVNERFLQMGREAREAGLAVVRSLRSREKSALEEEIRVWQDLGAKAFTAGGDRRFLSDALTARIAMIREASNRSVRQ